MVLARNTKWRGMLSTVDLLINVACFVTQVNNIFHIKSSCSKLVSTRRSSVLSIPFSKGFIDLRLRLVYIGDVFKSKMLATATRDSHYCTYLGHLGQHDKK